jgi:hypothetical protein
MQRERQALPRRAALLCRAVHSGAALRVDGMGRSDGFCGCSIRVLNLPFASALFCEVASMKDLRSNFFL